MPSRLTIIQTHKELETMTLTKDVLRFKATVEQRPRRAHLRRPWFTPSNALLDAFGNGDAKDGNRLGTLKLQAGVSIVTGRTAPSLYSKELATYDLNST